MNKKRKPKTLKVPGSLRLVLAENTRAAMERRFEPYGDRISMLAKTSGLSRSTVQRVVAAKPPVGVSVDVIGSIAAGLGIPAHFLLVPCLDLKSLPAPIPQGKRRRSKA